jgi:hypothetical protein
MLAGAAALSEMVVRYLIPSVPLIIIAGVLAVTETAEALRRRRGRPAGTASGRAAAAPAQPA